MWQYYRIVMTDSKARVDQLLNEEQRRQFDRLLQEHQPEVAAKARAPVTPVARREANA